VLQVGAVYMNWPVHYEGPFVWDVLVPPILLSSTRPMQINSACALRETMSMGCLPELYERPWL
jgi:hypothetical protein